MRTRLRSCAFVATVLGLLALHPARAIADVVVPTADVTTRGMVRKSASAQSVQIGSLHPGEQLELAGSVPNWYEIRLPNGTPGYVSKRWTRVVSSGTPPPVTPTATQTFTLDVV